MNSEGMETWKTSDPQTCKLNTALVCLPSQGNLSIFKKTRTGCDPISGNTIAILQLAKDQFVTVPFSLP